MVVEDDGVEDGSRSEAVYYTFCVLCIFREFFLYIHMMLVGSEVGWWINFGKVSLRRRFWLFLHVMSVISGDRNTIDARGQYAIRDGIRE